MEFYKHLISSFRVITLTDKRTQVKYNLLGGDNEWVDEWMKKALGETQILRAGCSKAEPKISAPPQTPFPVARDGQNLW